MISNRENFSRIAALILLIGVGACDTGAVAEVELGWVGIPDRPWAGPSVWTNRLQDWEVQGGRLQAHGGKPMRTAHVLTARSDPARGDFEMEMTFGLTTGAGSAGVLLGAGGPGLDWRKTALIHHSPGPGGGLYVGVDSGGGLFVRDFSDGNRLVAQSADALVSVDSIEFAVHVVRRAGVAQLSVEAITAGSASEPITLDAGSYDLPRLTGGLALVADAPGSDSASTWFSRVSFRGGGIESHEERALGPVLGAQHTLSRGVLTMTVQLFPLVGEAGTAGLETSGTIQLEVRSEEGRWYPLGYAPVITPGFTATFRIESWPADRDVPYRLSLAAADEPAAGRRGVPFEGLVRADPAAEDEIVVAAFTGNHNVASPGVDRGEFGWTDGVWFPHQDVVDAVRAQDPDLLFFSGDQVYEGASPTSADLEHPYLDYLYKWYLWVWAYRDLTAEIPAITIPDDHDVFHGNVWGAGGRATPPGLTGAAAQDAGGYKLPAAWVNMVQRTQTSHLPRPFDSATVEQGIGVYYTDVLYGGVSFGVIEDRKFKSPPAEFLPSAEVWNGWSQNPRWDARTQGDPAGAELLGERQERFLDQWAADWSGGAWMKVLLSQTIFANVATIPLEATSGSVIPGLAIPEPGAWVEGDRQAADMDSNGWPRSARDRAVRAIRKGFAVHLAGDQHLASTVQYGVDEFGDAGYAFCVPSVANFWPRRWYPPGGERVGQEGQMHGTGEFVDGFGNLITVLAVANPTRWGREPSALHDRAPGYGIARFRRSTREVSLEAWPRWADPAAGGEPYPGWPVRFQQQQGYGRLAWGYLPTLVLKETADPVVQVLDSAGEIVYTLRINGERFTPRVFGPGSYTVRVTEADTRALLLFPGLEATKDSTRTLDVDFR